MDWFALGRDLVQLLVGGLVFYWGLARQQQDKLWQKELEQRDIRLAAVERLQDRAGAKCSDLAGTVQALIGRVDQLPEHLRPMFMDKELAEERWGKLAKDLADIWAAIRARERHDTRR